MTLISIRDLENSAKINQLLNGMNTANMQNNLNFMLQNASVTKANLFTNAMFQQLQFQQSQQQQASGSMYNKNMILNSLSNHSISSGNTSQLHSHANSTNVENSNSKNQNQVNSSRYKTELCRQFIENGGCKYGEKCQFAHGVVDLKDVNRHPKYKTDYCKTFHSKGFCPYGPRCHFIHELNEKCDNPSGASNKKIKTPERPAEESKLDKQLEALHTRLSTNLLLTDDYQNKTSDKQSNSYQQHIEDLNSSFLSTSSPPLSPLPQSRARIGSGSSLVSSASSYDMSQSDRVFSPIKQSNSQQSFVQPQPQQQQQRPVYNIPLSKNLIKIGQSLIHEKLNNPSQDQAALTQQIANIERLNNLLNSNQFNFYNNDVQTVNFNW